MSDKDFIIKKLNLMRSDRRPVFDKLVEPLAKMAEEGAQSKKIKVPADGSWFNVSFDAIEVKENRLVISATRLNDGLSVASYDPSEKQYIVKFQGTRAAYLLGYFKSHHPLYRWPYISWDIRSYANHPTNPAIRVYVQGFVAHNELRKMISAMDRVCGTTNIFNKYINDNFTRVQHGIKAGKTIKDIEKLWSKGLMESLGYHHVEALGTDRSRGCQEIHVHWCKFSRDLRG